jgi:hypothetical protein
MLHSDWDLYDTRHVVYRPAGISPEELEAGYWRAYRDFYRWGSILRGARRKPRLSGSLRHVAYAAGWKKFEGLWNAIIRTQRLLHTLPILEAVLSEFGKRAPSDPEGDSSSEGAQRRARPPVRRPDPLWAAHGLAGLSRAPGAAARK